MSIDLGKIMVVPRGTYSDTETYERLDLVESEGSNYIAIKASKGVKPSNDGVYWQLHGAAGKDGVTFTPVMSEDGTLSWENDGDLDNPITVNLVGPKGAGGKSAYQYAQDGGYTGTEEEFAVKLAEEQYTNTEIDAKFNEQKDALDELDISKVDESDLETEVANQLDGAKADIVAELITQIGGMPVFGTVDDDNTITVTSTLADGNYVLKYENEDGTLVQIGTITVGDGESETITNYIEIVGYTENTRVNSSGEEVAQDGMCVTGYIPITHGTLRVKNVTISGTKTGYVITYNSNKEMITCWSTDKLVDDGTGVYEFAVTESSCAYIRLSIGTIDDTTIITVNEEIPTE